jgi:hypothetical protein
VGPNCAFASCWAREDGVPGTTVIEGETVRDTPKPMRVSTPAITSQTARAAFGRRIESFARVTTVVLQFLTRCLPVDRS